jgi:peptidoglycan/LPS O-acetylase OafA/YrhL
VADAGSGVLFTRFRGSCIILEWPLHGLRQVRKTHAQWFTTAGSPNPIDIKRMRVNEGRLFHPELEGIAAFAVLGEHVFLRFQGPELVRFLDGNGPWNEHPGWVIDRIAATIFPGAAAVSLFFVLSGFVLGETLLRSGEQSHYHLFIVRRLFRILPALWASVLVAAVIWNELAQPITLAEIGRHLWLAETWLNIPLWSLRVELVNSALLPVMWWLCGKLNMSGQLVVLLGLLGLSAHSFGLEGIGYSCTFWLGLMIPELGRELVTRLNGTSASLLLLSAVIVLCLSRELALLSGMHIGRLIAIFPSFYIISFLAYGPDGRLRSFMRSVPARYLGRVSYSFYLFHYPVLDAISLGMVAQEGRDYGTAHALFRQVLLFVLAVPATILVASACYRLIEKPGITLGKILTLRVIRREKFSVVHVVQ